MAQAFSKQTIGFVACSIAHVDPVSGMKCFARRAKSQQTQSGFGCFSLKNSSGVKQQGSPKRNIATTTLVVKPAEENFEIFVDDPETQLQVQKLDLQASKLVQAPKKIEQKAVKPVKLCAIQSSEPTQDKVNLGNAQSETGPASPTLQGLGEAKSTLSNLFAKDLRDMLTAVRGCRDVELEELQLLKTAAELAKTYLLRGMGVEDLTLTLPLMNCGLNSSLDQWKKDLEVATLKGRLTKRPWDLADKSKFESLVQLILYAEGFWGHAEEISTKKREQAENISTKRDDVVKAAFQKAFGVVMPDPVYKVACWEINLGDALNKTNLQHTTDFALEGFDEQERKFVKTCFTAVAKRLLLGGAENAEISLKERQYWAPRR